MLEYYFLDENCEITLHKLKYVSSICIVRVYLTVVMVVVVYCRGGMIQTHVQYDFVHQALCEYEKQLEEPVGNAVGD